MDPIKKLYIKYKDTIPYLFFGVCTTIINLLIYWVCARVAHFDTMPSTWIAWISAVTFAFFTNRKWVFHSETKALKGIIREGIAFLLSRITTGVFDWLCMFVCVELLQFNDVLIKFISNIMVVALNYVFSKYIVFKHKKS